jgi:hypothetical protein
MILRTRRLSDGDHSRRAPVHPRSCAGASMSCPRSSSISANVSADDSAGMPDGGSRHTAAGDECPTWAASETNQGCYSIRLLKRRERHSLRRCCERERKGNSDQPDHRSLLCELFKKVPWQEINAAAFERFRLDRIDASSRDQDHRAGGEQRPHRGEACRFPNQLCTDRGPSDPYGPSCWGEVPGFNRCRKSATHAQCREVRRMRCIVSTLVTARGRAAPPHQPRRYQPGSARVAAAADVLHPSPIGGRRCRSDRKLSWPAMRSTPSRAGSAR